MYGIHVKPWIRGNSWTCYGNPSIPHSIILQNYYGIRLEERIPSWGCGGDFPNNAYGLYIDKQHSIDGLNSYAIYQEDSTDKNYFAGNLGVGTASPYEKLEINGAITLGNTTKIYPKQGTIQWTGTDFEGYNGNEWVSLTQPSAASGVPSGAIIMWSGSVNDIPQGWFLCDGTNNTPDLSDRFIQGTPQNTIDVEDFSKTTDDSDSGNTSQYYSLAYIKKDL